MSLASLQNLTEKWHGIFTRLGLNVLIVQFSTRTDSPAHAHPKIEEALGLELQQIQAGYYDSSWYCFQGASVWHFFHCSDLAKAMNHLKAQLATRGLLKACNIMNAERHDRLCLWHSSDPECVAQYVEG